MAAQTRLSSIERRSRCIQGGRHAFAHCSPVRLIPIGRAQGFGRPMIRARKHPLREESVARPTDDRQGGLCGSGIDLPRDGSVEQTDTRSRSGGRVDRSFRAAVKFGRPELPQHICPCTLQEITLLAIDSNRQVDGSSLCALSPCAKYDFIERYSGFNCVSRHGHTLEISPFLP
jgi:hypothetical protein